MAVQSCSSIDVYSQKYRVLSRSRMSAVSALRRERYPKSGRRVHIARDDKQTSRGVEE